MTRSYQGPIPTKLAATIFNWVCKIQFHGLTIQNRSYPLKHVTQELVCWTYTVWNMNRVMNRLTMEPPWATTSLSDHLTKIPIGSSVSQIAISETSHKRPPLLSDHLTKILIGSSVSQIAISETSRKRPPPLSDLLSLTSRVRSFTGGYLLWWRANSRNVSCLTLTHINLQLI